MFVGIPSPVSDLEFLMRPRMEVQQRSHQAVVSPLLDVSKNVIAQGFSRWKDLVDIPPSINMGLSSARPRTMIQILGVPGALSRNCSPVTNPKVKALLVTQDLGPGAFKVTGLKPAVAALQRIFAKVKQEKPDLYQQIGTAGMLCCRRIRGGSNFSNHSWGTAIDLKISSELDAVGDGKTQRGLVELASYFHQEGFFWGAGFKGRGREDSMHFEVSEQLIKRWHAQGLLN
ncbi:MAG: M15 family metallopeptidase [Leptolyngbyaceae bacterium]|nr:M15 family metallopeptidase [Leptolyngbyaceae bacterium]